MKPNRRGDARADTEPVTTFRAKPTASADKLRGGYYTPDPIARFLARWVGQAGPRLLEPSCGDGAILRHLAEYSQEVQGVELMADQASLASAYAPVVTADFFDWLARANLGSWDGVAGNPPYIRFGHWPEALRAPALRMMEQQGLRPSRLTNAWVPFVVGSTLAVKPGGRIGLVVPAELLQVTYASQLRDYLIGTLSDLTLVSFDTLQFDGVLQEVVLLLGIRGTGPARIRTVSVSDAASLDSVNLEGEYAPALVHDIEKWTKYYLTPGHITQLRHLRSESGLSALAHWASVDVGIVTGRNSFFTLTDEEARRLGVLKHCLPLVSRSSQLAGTVFDERLLDEQRNSGHRTWILNANPTSTEPALMKYVAAGEAAGVHTGYKCSIRNPWWKTPSVWVPDAFMLRQIHLAPKIAANLTAAISTDTVHRLRLHLGVDAKALATVFNNSATFAFCEIMGRSYGGGILELEPKEAEALPIPDPQLADRQLCDEVDRLIREGEPDKARDLVDREVLLSGLGWSDADIRACAESFETLRDRRSRRGRRTD